MKIIIYYSLFRVFRRKGSLCTRTMLRTSSTRSVCLPYLISFNLMYLFNVFMCLIYLFNLIKLITHNELYNIVKGIAVVHKHNILHRYALVLLYYLVTVFNNNIYYLLFYYLLFYYYLFLLVLLLFLLTLSPYYYLSLSSLSSLYLLFSILFT